MADLLTLTGIVATDPRNVVTNEGLAITSFRLASSQRRFDKTQERWIDADTNWYTVSAFRQLAINAAGSLKKGERIVVTGKLRLREWQNGERSGTTVEIDAEALGHDLAWGSSSFSRSVAAAVAESTAPEGADQFESGDSLASSTVTDDRATEEPVPTPF